MKLIFALGLLLASPAFAEDPAQLFAAIAERQQTLDHYAVDLTISVFGDSGATVDQIFPARTVRRGPAMLQEFASFVILVRPDARLVVDRASRTIHVNPMNVAAPAAATIDPAAMLARARETGYDMDVDDQAEQATLRFTATARPSFTLVFDRPGLRLRRMEMNDASDPSGGSRRTVVDYTWRDVGDTPPERLDRGYYVRPTKSGWEPAPAFKGYRVVVSRER